MENKNEEATEEDIYNYNFIMEVAFGEDDLLSVNPPKTLDVLKSLLHNIRENNISFVDEDVKIDVLILMASYIKNAKDIKVVKKEHKNEVMH